jgi:hypothetical protein
MPFQSSLFEPLPCLVYPSQMDSTHQQPLAAPPSSLTGRCQFCGCAGNTCLDRAGERCDWTDSNRDCCTAQVCRVKLANKPRTAQPKPVAPQKPAKPGAAAKASGRRRANWGSRAAWDNYLNR